MYIDRNDYTKYRANQWATTWSGSVPAVEDKIGRSDSVDTIVTTTMITVSGVASLLPPSPLGRRSFIRIKNLDGSNSVSVLSSEATTFSGGYIVPAGGEWEENTDAVLYITTLAGSIDVQVYERSSRFNYN